MIAIYHSRDLDGICSGAILQRRYPEAKMIGYDYGEPVPLTSEDTDQDIIIADVSFPMDTMIALAKDVQKKGHVFTWIDHHISAFTEFSNTVGAGELPLHALYSNKQAACELVWEHCFPDTPIPPGVSLLGEYDSWRNQDAYRWKTSILPFQWGMRVLCNSIETFPSKALEDPIASANFLHDTITAGGSILRYQELQDARACRGAFEAVFEGHPVICLNRGLSNSMTFDSIWDPEKYHIMISFAYHKDKWILSLFTTREDVDCSLIAKQWGGGGHRKAAGFSVTDIRKVFPNIT